MWQLGIIVVLVIGLLIFQGGDIVRWHSALPSDQLNALASWASLYGLGISCVGLFVSGYAALGIRQIKTRFLAKARLPALGKGLQKNASSLSDMAEEDPIPQQEKTILFSSIEANLNAVRRHAPSQLKKSQKETKRAFDRLTRQTNDTPDVAIGTLSAFWDTYEKIQLLKNEIDHYLADEKWEN